MTDQIISSGDAVSLADVLRKGQVSPSDLFESFLQNCDRLNPKLNAVIRVLENAAASEDVEPATAPFFGVPMLLKDSGVSVAGVPTEYGSRYFKGYTRAYDSEIVRRYKRAGFVIIGKTNCSELGTSCSSETVATGSMRNPWDLDRSPGISSGGSAAAVAARLVPVAYATDAGGSIRGPASWCGLVGLKPSRGRVSYAPDAAETWLGLGTHHVMTRTVRDSAALLDISAGYVGGDPYVAPKAENSFLSATMANPRGLKIGFTTKQTDGHPFPKEQVNGVLETAKVLGSLGHHVEESSPTYETGLVGEIMGCASAYALAELVEMRQRQTGLEPSQETLELTNLQNLAKGRRLSAAEIAQVYKKINRVSRSFASFFEAFDIWLTPTMSDVASRRGYLDSSSPDVDLLIRRFSQLYQYNSVYNISGMPAITLPLYQSDVGLPIGMMFGAALGREDILFQLAAQLERAMPWRDRRPKHSC